MLIVLSIKLNTKNKNLLSLLYSTEAGSVEKQAVDHIPGTSALPPASFKVQCTAAHYPTSPQGKVFEVSFSTVRQDLHNAGRSVSFPASL